LRQTNEHVLVGWPANLMSLELKVGGKSTDAPKEGRITRQKRKAPRRITILD
jgi:hypothetical protein